MWLYRPRGKKHQNSQLVRRRWAGTYSTVRFDKVDALACHCPCRLCTSRVIWPVAVKEECTASHSQGSAAIPRKGSTVYSVSECIADQRVANHRQSLSTWTSYEPLTRNMRDIRFIFQSKRIFCIFSLVTGYRRDSSTFQPSWKFVLPTTCHSTAVNLTNHHRLSNQRTHQSSSCSVYEKSPITRLGTKRLPSCRVLVQGLFVC